MKPIIFTFYLFVILHFYSYSQVNLVPNPGFETITSCIPTSGGVNLGYLPPWDSPTDGTPDAYNTCIPISSVSVPFNGWGFQHPHSGNGYIGMCNYYIFSGNDYREYLQIELDSVLIAEKVYCASFYVSLANTAIIACNNFGVYFSSSHTFIPTFFNLSFIPHINDTNIITDTANWVLISGQYIAHGGEKYIIIGNFFQNTLTDTILMNSTTYSNYYYLDDVDVHYCDPDGVAEETNESGVRIFPNPANDKLQVQSSKFKVEEIKIYNMLGYEILKQVQNDKTVTIDVSNFANGIYFLEAQTEKGIVRKKFVKQ